jgi:hypothetical protein
LKILPCTIVRSKRIKLESKCKKHVFFIFEIAFKNLQKELLRRKISTLYIYIKSVLTI